LNWFDKLAFTRNRIAGDLMTRMGRFLKPEMAMLIAEQNLRVKRAGHRNCAKGSDSSAFVT
jgi:hypothetical protein